ncbi:MAG: DUF721 domain-containing protein [Crocinitomicaceae bacterium]|nr:DUF721 domain-containing protein [Crocinitomicaceae bacterium]
MPDRKYTDNTLKSIIDEMLRKSGLDKKYTELEIIRCYHEVVGKLISSKTLYAKVREKTLQLKLDSGVLKSELSYSKTNIIQMINAKMGSQVIENIEIW